MTVVLPAMSIEQQRIEICPVTDNDTIVGMILNDLKIFNNIYAVCAITAINLKHKQAYFTNVAAFNHFLGIRAVEAEAVR